MSYTSFLTQLSFSLVLKQNLTLALEPILFPVFFSEFCALTLLLGCYNLGSSYPSKLCKDAWGT
jgi:hypothetical protein